MEDDRLCHVLRIEMKSTRANHRITLSQLTTDNSINNYSQALAFNAERKGTRKYHDGKRFMVKYNYLSVVLYLNLCNYVAKVNNHSNHRISCFLLAKVLLFYIILKRSITVYII